MNKSLLKLARQLQENYKNMEEPSYFDYFVFLKTLIAIVELCAKNTFNKDYWHIYKAAIGFLNYPPNEENEHFKVSLKRELNFLIANLHFTRSNE